MPKITFVDGNDNVIGAGTKEEAYKKRMGRRLARIFLYNSKGELLIQKRSEKVSRPGKWDHSAAGHVDEGEDYKTAAYRELKEELGVTGVELKEIIKLKMESPEIKELWHFSMLYTGSYEGTFVLNENEVAEVKWIMPKDLMVWIEREPDAFPAGFIYSFKELLKLQNQI